MGSEPTVHRDVAVPMRDGVVLKADVYLPEEPGSYPVLLQRTPYDKSLMGASGLNAAGAVAAGYAVVIQDVRGRYASEGDFRPYVNDANDGYDTIYWAADQGFSNGQVGMYGVSYMGTMQYLAASAQPEPLKAIAPSQAGSSFYHRWVYEAGNFNLVNRLGWTLTMLADLSDRHGRSLSPPIVEALDALSALLRATTDPALTHERRAQLESELAARMEDLLTVKPLERVPIPSDVAEFYRDWLSHEGFDAFWQSMDSLWSYDDVAVPALHIGGWYDLFIDGTLQNFTELSRRAEERGRPSEQRLLVGPWTHGDFSRKLGDIDFGERADRKYVRFTKLHLDWFDRWLKDGGEEGAPDPANERIRLFVMGANDWRSVSAFPPPGVTDMPLYLWSGGNANGIAGDGTLVEARPDDERSDSYVHDPDDPVPSVGGSILGLGTPPGPRDQRHVEERSDVLVYTSDPLTVPLWLAGAVQLDLWAASDVDDTAFTAKLVHVHEEDGFAQNLTDGVMRTTFRSSMEAPTPSPVGVPVHYEIDLGSVCVLLPAGSQIRLEVASSNFPRFAVNRNTGGRLLSDSVSLRATQRVHLGGVQASCLVLPVAPLDG